MRFQGHRELKITDWWDWEDMNKNTWHMVTASSTPDLHVGDRIQVVDNHPTLPPFLMVSNAGAWELDEVDISKVLEKISVEPLGDKP
jgi:hypothetical protein